VDGHPDPQGEGGLALGEVAVADGVRAVGGHSEGWVEPVKGLFSIPLGLDSLVDGYRNWSVSQVWSSHLVGRRKPQRCG
jgi:hypothetical protein